MAAASADVVMQDAAPPAPAAPEPAPAAAAAAAAAPKKAPSSKSSKEKPHHHHHHHKEGNAQQQKRKREEGQNGDKGEKTEKAEPEFACRLKYRNTLPELPFDPKLRSLPLDSMRHVRYRITSLENSYRFPVLTDPDLGIPIDLLDPDTYRLPPNKPPLAPEDAALVAKTADKAETPRLSVQWLRKHQYITHDYSLEKLYTRGRQDSGRAAAAARRQREQRALSVEAQMEAIERGFEAAKSTPVHATNPSLVAQEVLHIVPDMELLGTRFTHVIFDTLPIPNPPHPSDAEFEQKVQQGEYLIARSVLKGYVESTTKEKFSVLYVPKRSADELKAASLFGDDGDEAPTESKELDWVRKYNYKIDDSVKDCFIFTPNPEKGVITYVPIDTKVTLTKSSVPAKEKPERVSLVRQTLTEEELAERQARVAAITSGLGEGPDS